MMDMKNDKKVVCPKCGSDKIRTIVYGLIRFKSEEDQNEFLKKHVPGGCCISKDNPSYHCDNCYNEF